MDKVVLVTGAKGFIGKNLVIRLNEKKYKILEFDIQNSLDELREFIDYSDIVIHLAGVNRSNSESEFIEGNIDLTNTIIKYIKNSGKQIPLLLSSSIQAEKCNSYGISKKAAENLVLEYIKQGNPGVVFRLHNVFGKWCKPDYNSVVATFCHNIANNIEIKINDPDTEIELVYIDDVLNAFFDYIEKPLPVDTISLIEIRHKISIGRLAERIKLYKQYLQNNYLPDFLNNLDKKLFSTYLTYSSSENSSNQPVLHSDERGWLFEFIKSDNSGQVFVSTTKPGITRGNHYHHTKIEKFCVIQGSASIELRRIFDSEKRIYSVTSDEPKIINIPPGYTHKITNIGDKDLVTLFWANEIFDKSNPDTYYEEV